MITVLHAFPENDEAGRAMHLRYWYGTVQPDAEDGEDPDEPVVCWCGGRHIYISSTCVGVWHLRSWNEREFHG